MERPILSPSLLSELAQDNPLGMSLTPLDVESWWQYIAWPAYKTRRYRNHKRAIRAWWARVTPGEIARARAAKDRADAERRQKIQDQLSAAQPPPVEGDFSAALKNILGGR